MFNHIYVFHGHDGRLWRAYFCPGTYFALTSMTRDYNTPHTETHNACLPAGTTQGTYPRLGYVLHT